MSTMYLTEKRHLKKPLCGLFARIQTYGFIALNIIYIILNLKIVILDFKKYIVKQNYVTG